MDPEGKQFGRGPRELGGAVDLINHYKLWPHHEFFCKRSLPLSISETHYLHNVVGDREIRKGEGMELDQLFQNAYLRERNARLYPFDLDILREAFQMRETTPINKPFAEKGIPTAMAKLKRESKDKERNESKDRERKLKKHKDRDKEQGRDHKRHKHRRKDRSDDKDNDKITNGHRDSGPEHLKKQQDRKRRHDRTEDLSDILGHQKNERKNSKINGMGRQKVAG